MVGCTRNHQFIHDLRDVSYIRSEISILVLYCMSMDVCVKANCLPRKGNNTVKLLTIPREKKESNIKRTLIILHLAIGDARNSFPSTIKYFNTKPFQNGRFAPACPFPFLYHNYSCRDEMFLTNKIYANDIQKILYCNFKYILSKFFYQ